MLWLSLSCCILLVLAVSMWMKIHLMHKTIDEIREEFSERLDTETNVLISVSSSDKHIRELAADINTQLRLLRDARNRYESGDQELREAVTNMSHDLRTPLTAICGYLDMLEDIDTDPEVKRYLGMIRNRTDVMRNLTEELFSYSIIASAKDPTEFEDMSLDDVLEESVAAYYGALVSRNIEPEISIPDEPVIIKSDRQSLGRIFGNIISNAVKYSSGDLRIVMDSEGSITFSNSAPGLDIVMAGRLFDRFYTVETGRNSTGLGLSIAKLLTERLGGRIYSEFEDGELSIRVVFLTKQDQDD